MNKYIYKIVTKIRSAYFKNEKSINNIYLIIEKKNLKYLNEIKSRIDFFLPGKNLKIHRKIPYYLLMYRIPFLTFGEFGSRKKNKKFPPKSYNIDFLHNHLDGWEWIYFINRITNHKVNIIESHQKFIVKTKTLEKQKLGKVYLFGTGPSLEKAIEKTWSDGYRIVCNTIVKDKQLWNHINPHFIVAGDAIHHFGFTDYAKSFRSDLSNRLDETNTYFIYPSVFDYIVKRELILFEDRLIPIPVGKSPSIHNNLCSKFELPSLGNVLPLLMLPIACTLSKNVYLWGFDGRAPNDQFFWKSSDKYNYPEYLPAMKKAHPAFFNFQIPESDPKRYINNVLGDSLDKQLSIAEKFGWNFYMLHNSWTPILQKRYINNYFESNLKDILNL